MSCGIVKREDDHVMITLKVQKEGTQDFYYTMKRDQPLEELLNAFCERRQLGDYRSLRYHVDGDRVRGCQTPKELQLEDGDAIDAWSELLGGGSNQSPRKMIIIEIIEPLRFTVKGSRVRANQTARELRLKNGSVVDAWSDQIGGAAFIH